jgi:hypothetical protein
MFQNWREMKFPAYQLAFFMLLIVADVANAIYSNYYAHNKHSVCIQIILVLKNCNLFAQLFDQIF